MTLLSKDKFNAAFSRSGLSQEELAERLGCSDRQIRNWCSRDTDVHVSTLAAMVELFHVKSDELLTAEWEV